MSCSLLGPGGLGPEWTPNPQHQNPHGERFTGPNGESLEWHPAQPGKPGWRGKDHWHWDPDGGKDGEHRKPGDEIPDPEKPACDDNCKKRVIWVPVLAFAGYVVYKTIVFWVCPPLVLVTP